MDASSRVVNNFPLTVFAVLVVGAIAAETIAMRLTGTLGRKHRREWSLYAVAVPFKAMLVSSVVEHVGFATRPALAMVVVGGLVAAVGVVIRVVCHFQLAGGFSPYVERFEGQRFVRSGLYASVRHPMYLGGLLLFVGVPLVLGARFTWLFSALGLIGILVRIRKEEAFLTREFPGYQEHLRSTWRLLPHIY